MTDYDFDKEEWARSMRFASMDCVIRPEISTPSRFSFRGLKHFVHQFVTIRKMMERRPDFDSKELQELYLTYKKTCEAASSDNKPALFRMTTATEAQRILSDANKRLNDEYSRLSWKALRADRRSFFEIEVTSFLCVNSFMGQMTNEDWVQLTYRAEGQQRRSKEEEMKKFVEYPVFETKIGDGVKVPLRNPFIVVAVMDKDGARYGSDGPDAPVLRKNFARNSKWYS